MNNADLARLELAKRAYRATEPSSAEVQTGVRRARLALRRPKARRSWFSKGLIMVVLAVGGLAYAKPHAVGALVSNVLQPSRAATKPLLGRGNAALEAPEAPRHGAAASTATPEADATSLTDPAHPHHDVGAPQTAPRDARAVTRSAGARGPVTTATTPPAGGNEALGSAASSQAEAAVTAPNAVSDWGRVGQALARGDEAKALAALSELSESDDARTRDKADLGRAQLFMANGQRDEACALAQSLTNRRAGSRIERQAQVLLKSCSR